MNRAETGRRSCTCTSAAGSGLPIESAFIKCDVHVAKQILRVIKNTLIYMQQAATRVSVPHNPSCCPSHTTSRDLPLDLGGQIYGATVVFGGCNSNLAKSSADCSRPMLQNIKWKTS